MGDVVIEAVDLGYTYRRAALPALMNVNFKIFEGELVVVTGHTGCGKSTLSRVMNGLIPHFYRGNMEGKMFVCGHDVGETPLKELCKFVGRTFQNAESQLLSSSVRRELAFGLENYGTPREEMLERISQISDLMGLNSLLDKAPYELSGGEMQRVALASILVMDPEVIVLDEPFGNLDWRGRKALFSNLLNLHSDRVYGDSGKLESKRTMVVFDHQIDPVIRIADRVIIMERGRIIQNGDPRTVFSNADAINMPRIVQLFHRLKQEEITDGKAPLTPEELSDRLAMIKKT